MCPWLTVEADTLQAGQSIPLEGLEFKMDSAERQTTYKGLHPAGSYALEMPEEWRDETGLWYFASWENGSPNRTRTVPISTDTTVRATFFKYKQTAPDVVVQPGYQRKLHFVRLTRLLPELKEHHDEYVVAAQAQLTLFEDKVRMVMDEYGVFSDMHHQYMAYALALDKSQREMRFMVDLVREHQILRDRFERRGLDPVVLSAIDQFVIYRG